MWNVRHVFCMCAWVGVPTLDWLNHRRPNFAYAFLRTLGKTTLAARIWAKSIHLAFDKKSTIAIMTRNRSLDGGGGGERVNFVQINSFNGVIPAETFPTNPYLLSQLRFALCQILVSHSHLNSNWTVSCHNYGFDRLWFDCEIENNRCENCQNVSHVILSFQLVFTECPTKTPPMIFVSWLSKMQVKFESIVSHEYHILSQSSRRIVGSNKKSRHNRREINMDAANLPVHFNLPTRQNFRFPLPGSYGVRRTGTVCIWCCFGDAISHICVSVVYPTFHERPKQNDIKTSKHRNARVCKCAAQLNQIEKQLVLYITYM